MRGIIPFVAAALLFGPGCGLETSGLEPGSSGVGQDGDGGVGTGFPGPDATVPQADSGGGADSTNVGADATTPSDDAGSASDATTLGDGDAETAHDAAQASDTSTVPDTGPLADACSETSDAAATATIAAWPQGGPPKIDGNLSEWPCDGYVHFSSANAAYSIDSLYPLAVDIQVRWDMQNVYVAAHVSDPNVGDALSYDGTNPYNNDSVEMYVSGDATLDGSYDDLTHQYITDYKGLIVDYGPLHAGNAAITSPADFSAAAAVVSGGWDYEASVSYKALGVKAMGPPGTGVGFAPGTNIALGFEVNDGTGSGQAAAIVLAMAPQSSACTCTTTACCCNAVIDVPSCDSTRIERVTLE